MLLRLLVLAAVVAQIAGDAAAQQSIGSFEFDKATNTTMAVETVFSDVPTHGFAPLRVTIRNGTDTERTWRLRVRISDRWNTRTTFTSGFSLAAAPGSETVHTVLAPVPTMFSSGYYGSLETRIDVSGGGFGSKNASRFSESTDNWPAIAISDGLATKNLLALNKAIEDARSKGSLSVSNARFGSQFRPGDLPDDWRGFSGLDLLMVTDGEWVAMPAGARNAVLEWTRFGGQLWILTTDDTLTLDAIGIPRTNPDEGRAADRLLGRIEVRTNLGEDGSLDHPSLVASIGEQAKSDPTRWLTRLSESYGRRWNLHSAIGNRSFAGWQVSVILILFGILVGPINLFVLAPTGRRHRLFFTTPLIALGTSVLLLALIFLQDGSGGNGRRVGFLEVRPSERKAYLLQEQIARTGVLLSRTFTVPSPVFLSPVKTRTSPWALVSDQGGRGDLSYSLAGSEMGGDWFQSRSEQGHFAAVVRATRARVERVAEEADADDDDDAPPTLLSSLEFPVERLYYRDPAGRCWASPGPVKTGERATLREMPEEEFRKEVRSSLDEVSDTLRDELVNSVRSARGAFTGVVPESQASGVFVPTLESVDWRSNRLVVHGPVDVPAP